MAGEIANTYEFRIIALQRSGHHAIINWMLSNIEGEYCYLNDCMPGKNPFDESRIRWNLPRRLVTNMENLDLSAESAGVHRSKDYLIYNYEEKKLLDIQGEAFRVNRDRWLGRSRTFHNVIVLRDPFNNLASRLMMEDKRRSLSRLPSSVKHLSGEEIRKVAFRPRRLKRAITKRLRLPKTAQREATQRVSDSRELFKAYAREYLGDTRFLPNKIAINYNRWFTDPEYRESVAAALHLTSADKGLDGVAKWGSGSSFDGTTFDGKARDMRVLERWKALTDDEQYMDLIDDPELHSLSERIFGRIIDEDTPARSTTT
jgi:hypothetical protein